MIEEEKGTITEAQSIISNRVRVIRSGENYYVTGLEAGEQISVYSIDGSHIYEVSAVNDTAVLPSWLKGICLLKTSASTLKLCF